MGIGASSFNQQHSAYSAPLQSKWRVPHEGGVTKSLECQEKRPSSWLVANQLPDGRIVGGSMLGDVTSWAGENYAAAKKSERLTLRWEPPHSAVINCICLLPGGDRIATASSDGTIVIRDVRKGKPLQSLHQHKGYKVHWLTLVAATAGHRSKWWMISTSSDKTACVWDTDSWEIVGVCSGHEKAVYAAAWIQSAEEAENYGMKPDRKEMKATDSASERTIITGDTKGGLYWWSLPRCRLIQHVEAHSTWITGALCLPRREGSRAVTIDANGQMIIWDVRTKKAVAEPNHNCGRLTSLSLLDAENSLFVSSSWGKNIAVWDGNTAECIHVHWLSISSSNVNVVSAKKEGNRIEAGVLGGFLTIYPILKWNIRCQRIDDNEKSSSSYITHSAESDVKQEDSDTGKEAGLKGKVMPALVIIGGAAAVGVAYYFNRRKLDR